MAVQFNASTDVYTATTGLPPAATFTVTCWVNLASTATAFATSWGLSSGGYYRVILAGNSGDTVWSMYGSPDSAFSGTGLGAQAITTGVWYKHAAVINSASGTFYHGTAGSVLTSDASATFNTTGDYGAVYDAFSIGDAGVTGEPLVVGSVANLKVFNASLTATQVAAELNQYEPAQPATLVRWHPFLVAETADYSGNGNTLTAGSTTPTTVAGPPIPWTCTAPVQPSMTRRRAANF